MDFGAASGERTSADGACVASGEAVDDKGDGSLNSKRKRPGLVEDAWRALQVPVPAAEVQFSSRKASENFGGFVGSSSLWAASAVDGGQKMLSFSSYQSPTTIGIVDSGSSRDIAFSVFPNELYGRAGALAGTSGGGIWEGMRGPFTPAQLRELELQALIYKHLVANVPVPSHLLIPLKKSLYSYGPHGSYVSNFPGWGPSYLGYSTNSDPEPGRCRRTDGKKWRCARDAVPDQKYCERHINRGRPRSRKPVEGHTGRAVSGSTSSKVALIASSSSASVTSNSSESAMRHQDSPLQPSAVSASADPHGRSQGFQGHSLNPPTTDMKSKDAPFSIQKPNVTFEGSSNWELGLVTSDSLLTPERVTYMKGSNNSFLQLYAKEASYQNPAVHFIEDWQKDQSTHAADSWSEEPKSDWTQLSMSIPTAPDLSSFSSAAQNKSAVSTVRLSHKHYPLHMGLGMSQDHGKPMQKQQSSWLPVTWGNFRGGPLGEALTNTVTVDNYYSTKAWMSGLQMGSSPTGVLQKSTSTSLSNSSYGSSAPSVENKKVTGDASQCSELLGSVLASAASILSE